MAGPLEGVEVLDLSQVGPASRCTAALRDLGAHVAKVLPPAGASRIEPPFFAYGAGRGMSSTEIDLQVEPQAFLRLVAGADVVVESYRPGVADRLGIGFDACVAANPRIVYAAVTGYGQQGPYAQRAGHDLNYLGLGGFLATQGRRADGAPAMPGMTLADSAGGGLHAALSICAALLERERTGRGTFLDVATAGGVMHLMALFLDEYLATGVETTAGSALLTGAYACYDVYPCADGGAIAVGAIEPKFFATLCRLLGLEQLVPLQYDEARQPEVRETLARTFASKPRDAWVELLADQDTCVTPVLSLAEVAEDPHMTRSLLTVTHREHGTFRQVGPQALAGGRAGPEPVMLP